MLAVVSKTEGSEKLGMREVTDFSGVLWLRGGGFEPPTFGL